MAKVPPIVGDSEILSDVSEASSYADARADTPTMGRDNQSDSEDTLSSLSFDENGILSPTSGGSDLDLDLRKSPGGAAKMLATASSPVITSFQTPPVPTPRTTRIGQGVQGPSTGMSTTGSSHPLDTVGSSTVDIQVRVRTASMDGGPDPYNLDLDLPSPTNYKAPTVDFPTSPNQLKIKLGPSFFPKEEELGRVSEDDLSFASSCRAKLDLNLPNGGVRLTKKDDDICMLPVFKVEFNESEPSSLVQSESQDQLEDYIEDFYLPLSHESVMQRQTSFRRKVQKQLETAATERAISELSKFESMLSTYDEEPEDHESRMTSQALPVKFQYNSRQETLPTSDSVDGETYPSLVDIDAICATHAPNLMRKLEDQSSSLGDRVGDSEESGYFIPKTTIDKLYAVYESSNFNNLYTLSGELKHILSPVEIEEIVANRVHLEKVIDPNVMAALSWSLNEASLPPCDVSFQPSQSQVIGEFPDHQPQLDREVKRVFDVTPSKTSSISNGFHSRNTSDASDDEVSTTSTPTMSDRCSSGFDTPDSTVVGGNGAGDIEHAGGGFERGGTDTASFRRRIVLAKSLAVEMEGGIHHKNGGDEEYNSISLSPSPTSPMGVNHGGGSSTVGGRDFAPPPEETWKSLESLNDLDVDEVDSETGVEDELCFVRRDSKRFNGQTNGKEERVLQGLFVETKSSRSNQGTLTRVRVPLNLSQLEMEGDLEFSPRKDEEIYEAKKAPKKRIPLDENLLRTTSLTDLDDSSQATDADVTLSEVFHSCLSKSGQIHEDVTIHSDTISTEDDVTLDLDTPDDMAESILGRLDSLSTSSGIIVAPPLPELTAAQEHAESGQWKSFSVGSTEIQIDLRSIQPYRKVISHGGYFDAEKKVAIILFSGCFLPDRSRREYVYVMDQLFLYVLSTLEELIVDDYILVYLHGATPKSSQPSFGWLKRCYQLLDRKLRKNLKGLYLVHPSFWLKTVVALTKPFVSSKFSSKLQFVSTLAELCLELPTEHLVIPEPVLQFDGARNAEDHY